MTTHRGMALAMAALVAMWVLPLGGLAQDEGSDSTTTTVEIKISATSITSTTVGEERVREVEPEVSGDTLPFTGPSSQSLGWVAVAALAAGMLLVAFSRRSEGDRRLKSDKYD